MDIIKRLQLNRNPKDIKSGSIVGAKNIMFDPISSSITNEYGFYEDYQAEEGFEIKGVISCNEEICIFLHRNGDLEHDITELSRIDRLKDGNVSPSSYDNIWQWEGGEVVGTFAYNYKKELILAISELGVVNKDVPLKVINLDNFESIQNLTGKLEENIPQIKDCNYEITNKGNLVCGVYTFFIRYKLSDKNYTKWFQLTDDIIITNLIYKDSPIHHYSKSDGSVLFADAGDFTKFYVNENLLSSSAIEFNLEFDFTEDCPRYTNYQIGYIIKRSTEVLGRLYGEFSINDLYLNITNNEFIEEVNIDNFLEIPHQFYNVKNLINYNNRLYISNYKEYKNESINNLNDFIKAKIKLLEVSEEIILNRSKIILTYNIPSKGSVNPYPINNYIINQLNHSSSVQFVIDYIKPYIDQCQFEPDTKAIFVFPNSQSELGNNLSDAICIYSDFDSSRPQIDDSFFITFENGYIVINSPNNGKTYILNGEYIFDYLDHLKYWSRPQDPFNPNQYPSNPYAINWFKGAYSTSENLISDVNIKYNNNRTLIPEQVYNLFIHFVRKDGSFTPGFQLENSGTHLEEILDPITGEPTGEYQTVDNLDIYTINNTNYENDFYFPKQGTFFKCPRFNNNYTVNSINKEFIIVPIIDVDEELFESYQEFIGYFISYESIQKTSVPVVCLNETQPANDDYRYTNSEIIYNNNIQKGSSLKSGFSKQVGTGENDEQYINNTNINTSVYKEKNLILNLNGAFDSEEYNNGVPTANRNDYSNHKTIIHIDYDKLYYSLYKTLYRLTDIRYIDLEYNKVNAFKYLPGFYNREKIVTYDQKLFISAVGTYVYKEDNSNNPQLSDILDVPYEIKSICYRNFSHICLNALSIKQDYDQGAVVINNKTYFNKVLAPHKLSDFLELKKCYNSKPVISYTNFDKNNQDEFNKTIYRSDIISDESLNNGFRHFNIENYKNIIENKGNIVNIIGIGLYLLVHTEYSLFVFDRNNQLTNNAQLQIPDTFDIDYKELTPSNEGFGGLQDKNESILTKHGYIWFDRISKSIFIFTGQEIKPISADIHSLLQNWFKRNYSYIRFVEDYFTNRLIITLRYDYMLTREYVTLSYSFDTNCFISAHDYTFDRNYKTYNKSYIFNKNIPNKLFVYKKDEQSYCDLDNGITNKFPKIEYTENETQQVASYIDILFNDLYETPKVLNSISYILSRNNNYDYITNEIDKYFNDDFDLQEHQNRLRLYSGFKLFVTSDLMFSGELDISQDLDENDKPDINKLNTLKPYWNNGIWNFNNIRENINKNVTNAELIKQNVNSQMKEAYNNGRYSTDYDKSDMRSNIVGKYFILRFVFERNIENKNLKFETVDVNISKI